mmetsp:Transcript_79833/g.171094  ORF Transcript_79833/g.171094 Transcript_79833/m.171094 type:complete len:148 (-) Transcript_79833:42-485(-)
MLPTTPRSSSSPTDLSGDLAKRLVARSNGLLSLPTTSDIGRESGPPAPVELCAAEGSLLVRRQAQAWLATILRGSTVPELREVCRLCKLPASGAKEDLVRRLAYPEDQEASTPPPSAVPRKRRASVGGAGSLGPSPRKLRANECVGV